MVSKCPIDPRRLQMTTASLLSKFVEMTQLPWSPVYNQKQNHGEQNHSSSVMYMYAMVGTILFTVLVFLLERILDERQAQSYQQTEFPMDLSLTVSKIDSDKAKEKTTTEDIKDSDANESSAKKIDTHKPILPQLQEKFSKAQGTILPPFHFTYSLYTLFLDI